VRRNISREAATMLSANLSTDGPDGHKAQQSTCCNSVT
jgi:hypothetical protein